MPAKSPDVDVPESLAEAPHFADMNRNYALIRLFRTGTTLDPIAWFGGAWVGVSGLAKPAARPAKGGPFFLRCKAGAGGVSLVDVGPLLQKKLPDERPYIYTPFAGMHCSEPPLVNACAHLMSDAGMKPDELLECFLLTERLPCQSCVHVLQSFRQGFPGLRLHLLYLFDHTSRVETRLKQDMLDLADSVHLLEFIGKKDPGYKSDKVYGGNLEPSGPSLSVRWIKALGLDNALVRAPWEKVLPRGSGSPSMHFVTRIPSRNGQPDDGLADR